MATSISQKDAYNSIHKLDKELSNRFIALDPIGYFIIKLDIANSELVVEHYANDIDHKGRAIDPKTGKPLKCEGSLKRKPLNIYRGKSAKALGIKLTESTGNKPLSKLDHALYLGRELQRAEACLIQGIEYIQD